MNTNNQTPEQILSFMIEGNKKYVENLSSNADISTSRREETATNGQHPYALVVTCSDSRVPPEHIFSAGLGDLFVVRTAGNVIGDFELGSIEYGVLHLGIKVVIVMGHSGCGAVSAAFGDSEDSKLGCIIDEIKNAIGNETDKTSAENKNIMNSVSVISNDESIKSKASEIKITPAKYDIHSGKVEFFE